MSVNDDQSNTKETTIRWLMKALGILLLVTITISICMGIFFFTRIHSQTQQELKELEIRSQPTSFSQLEEQQKRFDNNAVKTELWLAGIAKLESINFDQRYSTLPTTTSNSNDQRNQSATPSVDLLAPELKSLIEDIDGATQHFHQAEKETGSSIFASGNFRDDSRIASLTKYKTAARALSLDVVAATAGQDSKRTGLSLRALAALQDDLQNELFSLSQLVRLALTHSVVHSSVEAIRKIPIDIEDLSILQSRVRNFDPFDTAHKIINGERVYSLEALRGNVKSTGGPMISIPGQEAMMIQFYESLEEVIKHSLHQWNDEIKLQDHLLKPKLTDNFWHRLQSQRVPALADMNHFLNPVVFSTSHLRLLDLAIASEMFRRKYGDWPSSMDQLVPEFLAENLIDPYDNKPLRMLVLPEGLILYSVGSDRIDAKGENLDPPSIEPNIHFPPAAKMPKVDSSSR